MQPELVLDRPIKAFDRLPAAWRKPVLQLVLAWLGLILLFWRDWGDMAGQWWNVSTYNHILLVPLLAGWLVKQRAPELAKLQPSAWWPGLLLLSGAAFIWLLGNISGLNLASHLGVVAMLQAALLALLGPRLGWALCFPLAYLLFLVPFGDMLVPTLQLITAKLTIALTHWSGIPAEIDGVFIDTPAGLFEVAEACSGVKFLVAMAALATLVAHVCFRSWIRHAVFMVVAIALPVLANGVRAWGTIYIAQSQGIEFAEGFDHIVYGWVFFAVVLAALLAAAWPFFDRAVDDRFIDASRIADAPWLGRFSCHRMGGWAALLALALLALGAAGWGHVARNGEAELPAAIALPEVSGWDRVHYAPQIWWEPRARGADHRLLARYRNEDGREVDVFFALYAAQRQGKEAGATGEGAVVPETPWRWLEPGANLEGGKGDWLQAEGRVQRYAVTFYRTRDLLTGSASRLKLAHMWDRITLRENSTALLIVSAEAKTAHSPDRSVEQFLEAVGPAGEWMDRLAQLP